MPEVVAKYLAGAELNELDRVYEGLTRSYLDDIGKYSSPGEAKYLRHVLGNSYFYAGELVNYSRFAESNYKYREMFEAFAKLEQARLIKSVEATKSERLPLHSESNRPKKLIATDVGIVNYMEQNREEIINRDWLNSSYRGRVTEQVVGQHLIHAFLEREQRVFYWAREKEAGEAELDFCIQAGGGIMGIEVKSGSTGRLRSLYSFAQKADNPILVRIYGGELRVDFVEHAGKTFKLHSVPFYLLSRITNGDFANSAI